jgi:transposase
MSGRPHITITESVEVLLEIRKQQKRILAYNKVQMLYLFQSKQVETVREISSILGKSETTIHRWLFQYKEGGIENLLKNRQVFGRPKKFSVEVAALVQQELRDPEGFSSYKEVHLWLWLIKEIPSSYQAVYSLVKGELKSKLKIPRPRSNEQEPTAINEFKNSLPERIKALLDQAPDQVKKYKKFLFWSSDETRLGLHTIQRRRITLRGVKPVGKHQWKFKCFWLYGAVSPSTGRSFFWEFSHLDKVCFQAYLEQLSLEYPDELHIIQVDNARGHLLSTSELPDNIILLFQPPHCPEVNPTERVWEYIKEFLAWLVFSNLDELRVKVQEILSSLTNHVIGFLTGWSWILHSLSLAHL